MWRGTATSRARVESSSWSKRMKNLLGPPKGDSRSRAHELGIVELGAECRSGTNIETLNLRLLLARWASLNVKDWFPDGSKQSDHSDPDFHRPFRGSSQPLSLLKFTIMADSGTGIQELMAAETRASQIVAEARIGKDCGILVQRGCMSCCRKQLQRSLFWKRWSSRSDTSASKVPLNS